MNCTLTSFYKKGDSWPRLFTFCSQRDNKISLSELETTGSQDQFDGVMLRNGDCIFYCIINLTIYFFVMIIYSQLEIDTRQRDSKLTASGVNPSPSFQLREYGDL